jgi:hypothetical protein
LGFDAQPEYPTFDSEASKPDVLEADWQEQGTLLSDALIGMKSEDSEGERKSLKV